VGKGSGLGLAVVHGIVQAHEGTITAESVADRGATFRVYLPAASGSAEIATATPRVPREPGNHGRRILFLDDEPALVAVGVRLLEARGYRVFGFTRPADAMAAVRRDAASFDIVVTDFKMPGLSGLDVANEIGRLRSDLPVVVVSGHLDEETRRALASSCARAFLEKPYSGARLAEVLSGLLGD
jgi:CheY-like chemotaxis protein